MKDPSISYICWDCDKLATIFAWRSQYHSGTVYPYCEDHKITPGDNGWCDDVIWLPMTEENTALLILDGMRVNEKV